jgi:Ca-activated chloride channel family protein
VKIQVEFNPRHVGAYRLIGYENRLLAAEDFSDDTKDAGEVGAGHSVTALYEIEPVGAHQGNEVDPLRYQPAPTDRWEGPLAWIEGFTPAEFDDELMLVKLRYKSPLGDRSRLITRPVSADAGTDRRDDLRFAAAVAAFGMLLRESPYAGSADFDMVLDLAEDGANDLFGYRQEFVHLVRSAERTVAAGW